MKNHGPKPPDLIVSVESRKGGVGKTTAALCLARLLRKSGYAVLVLDLDVTGTNAADIADSPFWKEDLNIIREGADQKTDADSKPPPVNLLTLFEQGLMAGKAIPEFSAIGAAAGRMFVDLSKVNVLGSQIYGTDRNKGPTAVDRPAVLFDDLHTLWLLELVKQITANFSSVAGNKTKLAVILDNSPGYVGIAPTIHDWLTDLGPERGKFLTVTSLDIQDILACQRAIDVLHKMYAGKWETSRLFDEASRPGEGVSIGRSQEGFLLRLAAAAEGHLAPGEPLAFYRQEGQGKLNGQAFIDAPGRYMAIIVNRVPRAVKTGRLIYEPQRLLEREGHALTSLLSSNEAKQNWRDRMVAYDEYIENQFLLQSLRRGRGQSEWRTKRLIDVLKATDHELRAETRDSEEDAMRFVGMGSRQCERLYASLSRADSVLSRTRISLADAGLGHLARLIQDEWLPGSIVPDFRSAFSVLLREGDFPHFEMSPFEFDTPAARDQGYRFVEEIRTKVLMMLRESPRGERETADEGTADVLAGVLSGLAGLALLSPWWHSPVKHEIAELFAGVLAIELAHWRRRGQEGGPKFGIQRFLAQESVKPSEFEKEIGLEAYHRFFHRHMMREGRYDFADFYQACTSAQARLIDFVADSRFLVQFISFILEGELAKGDLFPFVRGLAEEVIINKTVNHEEAPSKMAKALQAVEYFRDFDNVLRRVLADWQVVHE